MKSLESSRALLSEITNQYFELLNTRKSLVHEIQSLKDKSFDYNQEIKIFTAQKDNLSVLSFRELLAYSLIIEEHASVKGDYPSWSNSVHLISPSDSLTAMINPVLLKIIKPDDFQLLKFNAEFQFLAN